MARLLTTRRTILALVAALGIGTGLATGSAFVGSAHAACSDVGPVNVSEHLNEFRRGERAADPNGITVAPNTVCAAHVNSLVVINTSGSGGEEVEAGWINTKLGGCNNFKGSIPTGTYFFWVWVNAAGVASCDYNSTGLNPPTNIRVKISDSDESGVWHFFLDGTEQPQTYSPGFVAGDPATNGERHNSGDSGNAKFQDLQYEDSSGFHDWDQASIYKDCDGTYGTTVTNFTEVQVSVLSDGYYPSQTACNGVWLP